MTRNVWRAIVIGATAEAIIATLLLLASGRLPPGPPPVWVEILNQFQKPAAPLVLRLIHTEVAAKFAAEFPNGWILCAQLLGVTIQAIILALVTLAAIHAFHLLKRVVRALA